MAITEDDGRTVVGAEASTSDENHLSVEFVESTREPLPPAEDPHNSPHPQPSTDANIIPPEQPAEYTGVEGRNEPPGESFRLHPLPANQGNVQHVAPSFHDRAQRRAAARYPRSAIARPVQAFGGHAFASPMPVEYEMDLSYGEMQAERFFAGYMDQLFHIPNADSTALQQAVVLVRALRDTVISVIRSHIHASTGGNIDPFFGGLISPSMDAILAKSEKAEEMRETVPLVDYLHRLANFHPMIQVHRLTEVLQSNLVQVGVSKNAEEQGHHYLLMPDHEELVNSFADGTTKFQLGVGGNW